MKNKRKVLVISLIAALLAICALGTSAYFTDRGTAKNIITTGGVKIDLIETAAIDGENVPFEDVVGVMPGSEVSKIVEVKNIGESDAYIRVSVEKALALAEGREGGVDLSLVTLDFNTEAWTEADGYYYYNRALRPGETTEPLFTTVTFAETMGNEYQNSTAAIDVKADAVQTANNGETALDAAGWPAA